MHRGEAVASVLSNYSAGTDAAWWLSTGMLSEWSWIDSRKPDARPVDAVESAYKILEVDVVVTVVVENQFLEVPAANSAHQGGKQKRMSTDLPLPLGI